VSGQVSGLLVVGAWSVPVAITTAAWALGVTLSGRGSLPARLRAVILGATASLVPLILFPVLALLSLLVMFVIVGLFLFVALAVPLMWFAFVLSFKLNQHALLELTP
jgi:uncharacterized membrane protein YvlD (DUF360 family)